MSSSFITRRVAPVQIGPLDVTVHTVLTDGHEADGTLEWDSTTAVVVRACAGTVTGVGYTYTDAACAEVIRGKLSPLVEGRDPMDVRAAWDAMSRSVRNFGRPGICASAIAAVDSALWDVKARLLDVPLVSLLGAARDSIPVYGSGGFTSYSDERLAEQVGAWVRHGIGAVKIKVGSEPERDPHRIRVARGAVGPDVALMADANGAYARKQALAMAEEFAAENVSWFEEPVSSDDLEGLRLLRDRAPAGMAITAGEYGYDLPYFRRMIEAGAIDVLQADATRCLGITGFMGVAALCEAACLPLSAHTAPALHTHVCCAAGPAVSLEYFHDHEHVEQVLFDGLPELRQGCLVPDLSRPGNGLELRLENGGMG
ncbi:MAG: enolase C-terminal domain-like protein [Gaiellales bacterium]